MKFLLGISCALLALCACTTHNHYYDSAPPEESASRASVPAEVAKKNRVTGRVVDADGQPVAAYVSLIYANGGSMALGCGSDGVFSFDRVSQTPYVLTAASSDRRFAASDPLSRPTDDVQLVVEPGALIQIRMTGRPTARFAAYRGDVRIADFTVRDGKPESFILPTGEVRAEVYDRDSRAQGRFVNLRADSEEVLTFDLESW